MGSTSRWREIDFPQALLVPQRQVDVRVAMADRHNSTGKLALLVFSPCPTMMSRYRPGTGECDSGGDPQSHCLQLKHRIPHIGSDAQPTPPMPIVTPAPY